MGVETALVVGLGIAGGAVAAKAMSKSTPTPKIESTSGKSIEAGISDSEDRRRSVMQKMATLKKQTLLARQNQPSPMVKSHILGAG